MMSKKERKMLEQEVASLWRDVRDVLQDEQYKEGYLQAIADVMVIVDEWGKTIGVGNGK